MKLKLQAVAELQEIKQQALPAMQMINQMDQIKFKNRNII
tara:strand:+ start:641 stop:760 length:120 start_codon:yes stop_codon:yes gene_type:complete